MSSALNGVRKWFVSPTGQKSEGLKAYPKVGTELFPFTRPSFLGLSKEAGKASADHEIRPILVAQRELPLNAGYSDDNQVIIMCFGHVPEALAAKLHPTTVITGQQRRAPEGTWVLGGGIEPKLHQRFVCDALKHHQDEHSSVL